MNGGNGEATRSDWRRSFQLLREGEKDEAVKKWALGRHPLGRIEPAFASYYGLPHRRCTWIIRPPSDGLIYLRSQRCENALLAGRWASKRDRRDLGGDDQCCEVDALGLLLHGSLPPPLWYISPPPPPPPPPPLPSSHRSQQSTSGTSYSCLSTPCSERCVSKP